MQNNVELLIEALNCANVPTKGRGRIIAGKTGYSTGMISKVLSGKVEAGERFLTVVSNAFGINIDFVNGLSASPLTIPANNSRWYSAEEKEEIHFISGLLHEPILLEGARTLVRFSEAYRYEAVAMLKKLAVQAEKTGDWTPPGK